MASMQVLVYCSVYLSILSLLVIYTSMYCFTSQAKAFVADPSAFLSAMPVVQQEEEKGGEEPPPEKPPESEEESDDDMGFGLFDQKYCIIIIMYRILFHEEITPKMGKGL